MEEKAHYVPGNVLSAFPLSDDMKERLENHFSSIIHERVKLTFRTDPSIIGGIIVTIGHKVYDGSIRSQLNRLKEYVLQD